MFYTIYKVTNIIDGNIYIGKHQTKNLDDGYMGSGKRVKYVISKHGIENFKKEILYQFDNEDDMNAKEAELVTEDFCSREDTYNICPGGNGGFGYINKNGLSPINNRSSEHIERSIKGGKASNKILQEKFKDPIFVAEWKEAIKNSKMPKPPLFTGKVHTPETKKKISEANSKMVGDKNSQFGTMWITDGQNNKKVKKDIDIIPEGWYKGRK